MDGQQYRETAETMTHEPLRWVEQVREVCLAWISYQQAATVEFDHRASEFREYDRE